jgi:hypothetical protein
MEVLSLLAESFSPFFLLRFVNLVPPPIVLLSLVIRGQVQCSKKSSSERWKEELLFIIITFNQ